MNARLVTSLTGIGIIVSALAVALAWTTAYACAADPIKMSLEFLPQGTAGITEGSRGA